MLNRLALRIATVRALRGKTYALANVFDSQQTAIDDLARDQPQPFIVVYTDDGRYNSGHRDLLSYTGDHRVDVGYQHLVIEMGITQLMTLRDDAGNELTGAGSPRTDAALEYRIDLMERQVIAALLDQSSDWAGFWREMVVKVATRDSSRGGNVQDGVRFVGRQIRLSVELWREPTPGAALSKLWQRFLALAQADADLAPLVPDVVASLAGAGTYTDSQLVAMTYGLSGSEMAALKFPLEPNP